MGSTPHHPVACGCLCLLEHLPCTCEYAFRIRLHLTKLLLAGGRGHIRSCALLLNVRCRMLVRACACRCIAPQGHAVPLGGRGLQKVDVARLRQAHALHACTHGAMRFCSSLALTIVIWNLA